MSDKWNSGFNGGILGALFGGLVFPVLWMIALFAIPVENAAGEQVKNPSSAMAVLFMIPLAIVGAIVFGAIGALIGYALGHRKEKRP